MYDLLDLGNGLAHFNWLISLVTELDDGEGEGEGEGEGDPDLDIGVERFILPRHRSGGHLALLHRALATDHDLTAGHLQTEE